MQFAFVLCFVALADLDFGAPSIEKRSLKSAGWLIILSCVSFRAAYKFGSIVCDYLGGVV